MDKKNWGKELMDSQKCYNPKHTGYSVWIFAENFMWGLELNYKDLRKWAFTSKELELPFFALVKEIYIKILLE